MLSISALIVAVGFYNVFTVKNLDGVVLMIVGSLFFLFFTSVKHWQYKADKSLYR